MTESGAAVLGFSSLAPPSVHPAPVGQRLIFLDGARAIAIVLMVFAHLTDQLLEPALHAGAFGTVYATTRGFTAPLFFVVSGWSFAVAVLPRVAVGTADFPRRLRRAGLLLFWGYVLTLPWWAPGFPLTDSAGVWLPFWTAGVLQALGAVLLIATGLLWVLRVPWVFLAVSAAVAALALVAAPWAVAMCASWPPALRGYFDAQGVGGGFPLAPWAGYFFAGVAVGGALWIRSANSAQSGAALLAIAGVGWLAVIPLAAPLDLIVWRFAWVAAIFGAAAFATASSVRLPFALRTLGQHALTFYVAHMVLLWGAPYFPGLVQRVPPEVGWVGCLALTFGCLAVTALGIWLWARARALLRLHGNAAVPSKVPAP